VAEALSTGVTGQGIKVVVLDDGLEWRHDDLMDNFVRHFTHPIAFIYSQYCDFQCAECSFDWNNGTEGDPDPTPRYPVFDPNDPNAPLVST